MSHHFASKIKTKSSNYFFFFFHKFNSSMASYMHNQRANLTQAPKIPSSTSSSSLSSYQNKNNNNNVMNKPSWFFIFLLFSISVLTFFLQWRGDYIDQVNQLPFFVPPDGSSSSDCASRNLTIQSSSPVSPEFRSFKFLNDFNFTTKICITSTTAASLEEVLPWIFYHKVVGISNFFLFVEGKAASPNVTKVLESIPGVKVIPRTRELEEQQAQSRIWNETWLADAFNKPCNAELFVKQNLNMEMAIVMARDSGMEWILHVDTDELLHPAGTRNYSVSELLTKVPSDVDAVVFSNYEIAVERDDIREPFTEASMFKKNFEHLPTDSNFELYKIATRGNPNYFLTYSNGKSAARVQDHLRPNGAHRWYNYFKEPKEMKLEDAAILHYTYSRFSDLTSRRDRCNCKPTQEDVKRCFWLEFDRIAFIIASTETQESMLRWYRDHVVWDNEEMNLKLLKYGVFTRIYTPMVIIQKLRESGVFDSVIASAQATSH